jgi:hypothetical protein
MDGPSNDTFVPHTRCSSNRCLLCAVIFHESTKHKTCKPRWGTQRINLKSESLYGLSLQRDHKSPTNAKHFLILLQQSSHSRKFHGDQRVCAKLPKTASQAIAALSSCLPFHRCWVLPCIKRILFPLWFVLFQTLFQILFQRYSWQGVPASSG